jgi:hypothetical protein
MSVVEVFRARHNRLAARRERREDDIRAAHGLLGEQIRMLSATGTLAKHRARLT